VLGRLVWSTENCGSCEMESPHSHKGWGVMAVTWPHPAVSLARFTA
jgi:hypothetical protein